MKQEDDQRRSIVQQMLQKGTDFLWRIIVLLQGAEIGQDVATPGTDNVGWPKASEISELRRTAKWRDPPEETEEEDDFSLEKN